MSHESKYFALSMDSLRALGAWAADCAERALPIFERHCANDTRPREAIAEIRVFADGGKRNAKLRAVAWAAYKASLDAPNPAAAAAANAASLAAASAYTHPIADIHQSKHILGPACNAALALELDQGESLAEAEIAWAIEQATADIQALILHMPAREPSSKRLEQLFYLLDNGIRQRTFR